MRRFLERFLGTAWKWGSGSPPLFCSGWVWVHRLARRAQYLAWEKISLRVVPEVEQELADRIEDLGFELVEVRWGGSGQRPQLKLRIDRPGSVPGSGVTVDECASVSRALEPWLDAHEALPERYVLEVSSPGVERPLVRGRDFERFRGEKVAVVGTQVLAGLSTRLEGELLGLEGAGSGAEAVKLKLSGKEGEREVSIPRSQIRKANLLFEWK